MPKKAYMGPFAKRLNELMEEHDPPLDRMSLSDESGLLTYEHSRKLTQGLSLPSVMMARELARFFKIEPSEFETLLQEDKFERNFGEGAEKPIFNPELQPFVSAWPLLTKAQIRSLTSMLKDFVKENTKIKEAELAKKSGAKK